MYGSVTLAVQAPLPNIDEKTINVPRFHRCITYRALTIEPKNPELSVESQMEVLQQFFRKIRSEIVDYL